MKQIPEISTERLLLRPFRLTDAPGVQELAGDWAIADTTLSIPHPYSDGLAEKWIASHQPAFEDNKGIDWAIVRKEDTALIGAIGLMGWIAQHKAEMGYWIGKPFWGHGFCTEAARAVLNFSFHTLQLIRVYATHFKRNPASGRVMQKMGMSYEGCMRQHIQKRDKFEDLEIWGIVAGDRIP